MNWLLVTAIFSITGYLLFFASIILEVVAQDAKFGTRKGRIHKAYRVTLYISIVLIGTSIVMFGYHLAMFICWP